MSTSKGQRVAFLDRDGTINIDRGYVHKVEDWEFAKGAVEGMKMLQDAGYLLAIVTNQSGIGHELYTEEDMHMLHKHMNEELEKTNVTISAIAFSPERRETNADTRKPNIGMAQQVEREIGEIDYQSSWVIGDKESDIVFAVRLGAHSALIRSEYWNEDNLAAVPDLIVDTLKEAAEKIV